MITLNKITTKQGDKGCTLGPGMKKTEKYNCNIEFLGKLDELNCTLGETFFYAKMLYSDEQELISLLDNMQHQIFDIGAMFFKMDDLKAEALISMLEKNIIELNKDLPELKSFLLQRGDQFLIAAHKTRSLCRSAERAFWATNKDLDKKLETIGIYLNRLSDLIFILIRRKSSEIWVPTI